MARSASTTVLSEAALRPARWRASSCRPKIGGALKTSHTHRLDHVRAHCHAGPSVDSNGGPHRGPSSWGGFTLAPILTQTATQLSTRCCGGSTRRELVSLAVSSLLFVRPHTLTGTLRVLGVGDRSASRQEEQSLRTPRSYYKVPLATRCTRLASALLS